MGRILSSPSEGYGKRITATSVKGLSPHVERRQDRNDTADGGRLAHVAPNRKRILNPMKHHHGCYRLANRANLLIVCIFYPDEEDICTVRSARSPKSSGHSVALIS